MPRSARLIVPGYPHHVTQRGCRRQRTFFDESDYLDYLKLLTELRGPAGVDVWAYCLMPNHVHVIAVPRQKESLAKLFGVAHHRYALRVNSDHGWRGHLWQERFHSCVMDDAHLLAAVRYVELNPVCAGLCARAEDWPWSSVHAHLRDRSDGLVTTAAMRERIPDWPRFLLQDDAPKILNVLRESTNTGHPAGDSSFIDELERVTGRRLRRQKPGPKVKS